MQKWIAGIALGVMVTLWAPRATVAQQCCPGEQCPGDLNCDNAVQMNEIITAVNAALRGCPAVLSPTPKATVTPGEAQRFPATGQTTCWGASGNVIACSGTGQDGDIRAGAALAYVDNGDGTITDLNTHLMWEKKDRSAGFHDYGNTYTWADALSTLIPELNAGSGFAGHTDWRLPNVRELQSIANYQNYNPAVDTVFNTNCTPGCTVLTCSCTQSFSYWSATSDAVDPDLAWFVGFNVGYADYVSKSYNFYVRAVRGGL